MPHYLKAFPLLTILSCLFWQNPIYAGACQNGANASGCSIGTDDTSYNLTGNIAVTGGTYSNSWNNSTDDTAGIEFTTGSDSNDMSLTGDISTTGYRSFGLRLESSDSNTFSLTGHITTDAGITTPGSDAIHLSSSDTNTINMTGNISTTGNGADGINLESSDSNTINMTGNILTSGYSSARGIYINQSEYNITNLTGNITTGDSNQSWGVSIHGGGNNTTNIIGNISAVAPASSVSTFMGHAIFIASDSNITNLTGNITMKGYSSHGIWFFGKNNQSNITGDISLTGANATGIYLLASDSNTTNVTGDISTTGANGYGILSSSSDSNTTNVTGDISTTADNTHGIYLSSSDSNTNNMTGKISATGSGSYAVYLDGTSDNNTFNFNQGSTIIGGLKNDATNNSFKFKQGVSIIGDIENNGDMTNKLIFDMGKAASYNFDFGSTTWTVEDLHKSVVNGSAKSMGVADIDNQAHILHRRTDSINDVLSERQRLYQEGQRPKGYYIDSYYVHDKRDKDQSQISGNAGGVTVGYALENTNTPMEVLVNYEVSKDKYGLGSEQTTESDSLLAGLFLPTLYEDVLGGDISAKVLIGASDNDVKRKVLNNNLGTGASSENVSGDYNSGFVSMGTEWLSEVLKTETVTHDISIGADLVQAYNENYTAGEYTVDSRNMTQLQSRVLYGVTYKNLEKTVDLNARFGIANQQLLSGEKQDYRINGTSVSFTGDDNSFYYTAGLGAKYYLKDNMNLYVDTKYSQSNDDIQDFSIDFGFISRF